MNIKALKEVKAKQKLLKAGVAALGVGLLASNAFAGGGGGGTPQAFGDNKDSFGQLLNTIVKWMQGNLGKLLALFGFIGTFIIYLMTHKGSVLFIGIIISLIAGGIVGIVQTFFEAGNSAFKYTAPQP